MSNITPPPPPPPPSLPSQYDTQGTSSVAPGASIEPPQSAVPTLTVTRQPKISESFGIIHVGETFRVSLDIENSSKTLSIHKLTVTAQMQTPTQRWHMPSPLDTNASSDGSGTDVPPGSKVDTIVSHSLEEVGQHILRVEMAYGEQPRKTLRKFYRFPVSLPFTLRTVPWRTGDASCVLAVTLENNLEESMPVTITSIGVEPVTADLTVHRITTSKNEAKKLPQTVTPLSVADEDSEMLEVGSIIRYLFQTKVQPSAAALKGIAAGDGLGQAVVTWQKESGETGRLTSPPIVCPPLTPLLEPNDPSATMTGGNLPFVSYLKGGSALSIDVASSAAAAATENVQPGPSTYDRLEHYLPVTVEPIEPPERIKVATPQQIQFLVVNHSNQAKTVQLQFRLDHMNGLAICGSSFQNLENLPPNGGSVTVSSSFLALNEGILRLQGCCVVDLANGLHIPQPPLFNVLVEKKV